MKLLIIYGTTEGQTRKICEYLRDEAKKMGITVSMNDSTGAVLSPFGFDAVIVASSVHNEKFQTSIEHYVQDQSRLLNNELSMLMTVSLAAAGDQHESWVELKQTTQQLLTKANWSPTFVEHVAGAIRYSKYNYFKKFVVRSLAIKNANNAHSNEDQEYTDWQQVKGILTKLKELFEAKKEQAELSI